MSEPRFKVGDLVVVRAHQAAMALLRDGREKLPFGARIIVGQISQISCNTCSGGTQILYEVLFCTAEGVNDKRNLLHEHELDPSVPKSDEAPTA